MDSLVSIFIGSFILGFSGAAMPGPMLTVVIRESARRGVVAGPLVVLGHAILEVATLAAIFAGLGAVLVRPLFFGLIGVVGGGVLIWMGIGMLRSLSKLNLDLNVDEEAGTGMHPILGGIVTSFSNPYFLLWWATAGLTFLTRASEFGPAGQATFYAGHILSDLTWYTAVSLMMHFGRSFLTDTRYRWMIGVLAVMLVFFGGWFGFEGAKKLLS